MNNPRNLAAAAVGVAGVLYLIPGNIFNTPATKGIGDAWSKGGGSTTHTPAIATPRGYAERTESNQVHAKGLDTEHFQENQASQRTGSAGPLDKPWNQAYHGTNEGHTGSKKISGS